VKHRPHGWYRVGRVLAAAAASLPLLTAARCAGAGARREPPKQPTVSVLRITHHVGGTHYRMHAAQGAWLQTFGSDLLVIEPRSARVVRRVELGEFGEAAPATDMLAHGQQLYVVLHDQAVAEASIADARHPRILRRWSAEELGIAPRRLALLGDDVHVTGVGGIVRLPDGRPVLIDDDDVSSPVLSDAGLIACIGRRIHRLEDGELLGIATELHVIGELGGRAGAGLLFVRQGERGALIGLMTSAAAELDLPHAVIALPGVVRSVRLFGDRIWAVTDAEVVALDIDEAGLREVQRIDVLGARDVAPLGEGHMAIAGTFGRTIYREGPGAPGTVAGGSFIHTHREPARLRRARHDGRFILAGSEEGTWLYQIGSRAELSSQPLERAGQAPATPPRTAATGDAEARISDDGRALRIEYGDVLLEYADPDGDGLLSLLAVEGDFWIARERGITVLRAEQPPPPPRAARRDALPPPRISVLGRLRLDGPVRIFPLQIERGVAFVAEHSGFGVARMMEEPARSPASGVSPGN
jgi:hypothetical protein